MTRLSSNQQPVSAKVSACAPEVYWAAKEVRDAAEAHWVSARELHASGKAYNGWGAYLAAHKDYSDADDALIATGAALSTTEAATILIQEHLNLPAPAVSPLVETAATLFLDAALDIYVDGGFDTLVNYIEVFGLENIIAMATVLTSSPSSASLVKS